VLMGTGDVQRRERRDRGLRKHAFMSKLEGVRRAVVTPCDSELGNSPPPPLEPRLRAPPLTHSLVPCPRRLSWYNQAKLGDVWRLL
jgi:hypothetical protein